MKALSLVGLEEVLRGLGLMGVRGDTGGDTADGAGGTWEAYQPSTDYWEEPGASQTIDFYFF